MDGFTSTRISLVGAMALPDLYAKDIKQQAHCLIPTIRIMSILWWHTVLIPAPLDPSKSNSKKIAKKPPIVVPLV